MTDLFALFSKLVTPQGKILVPGINEKVAPLTPEERKLYEVIDITMADLEGAVGAKVTISDDKAEALMARMRYPSLSIHGIEGAFSTPGAKTVIPASVKGASSSSPSPLSALEKSSAQSLTLCTARRQVLDPPRARPRARGGRQARREVPAGALSSALLRLSALLIHALLDSAGRVRQARLEEHAQGRDAARRQALGHVQCVSPLSVSSRANLALMILFYACSRALELQGGDCGDREELGQDARLHARGRCVPFSLSPVDRGAQCSQPASSRYL